MDKYEYKVRTDEMKQLIREGKFAEAMEIADTIDWRRVKNTKMLCIVSDVYKINHKFEESKEILLLAYEKNPTSRLIVYSLCELCIKMDEVVEANEYLKEFARLAPKDNGRYILRYKMLEAQDVSLEERISVLEEYKNREPLSEKWAYELAYLYHRVGLVTRCIEECDQLFLWFREGKYVLKALELKQLHTPLSAEQQYVYDQQFYNTHRTHVPKTAYDDADDGFDMGDEKVQENNIEVPQVDVSEYNTINLQKELAESMKEFLPQDDSFSANASEVLFSDTSAETMPIFEEPFEYVAPVDLSQTQEVLIGEDTGSISLSEEEALAMAALEATLAVDNVEEVFKEIPAETVEELLQEEELPVELIEEEVQEIEEESVEEVIEEVDDQATKIYKPITDEMIMQATRENFKPKMQELQENMTAKLPVEMARMLSQEYDGQISLVVPETEQVEKQITGQLNIIDVMAEWEKIKKAAEEKRAEEVRQHVLEHTGNIFVEFDEVSKKKDILEGVELTDTDDEVLSEEAIEEISESMEEIVEESATEEVEETEEIEFEVVEVEPEELPEDEEIIEEEEIFEDEEIEEQEEIFEDEEIVEEEEIFEDEEIIEEEEIFEDEEIVEEEEIFEDEETVEEEEIFEDEETVESDEEDELEDDEPEDGFETDEEESPSVTRSFSSDEKMLFHSFVQTKKDRKKLIAALDEMSLAAYTGNVIITGEETADTTALAKAMIKNMQVTDANFSGKIAKITGAGLENKDIKEVLDKLENGALIVESADKMPSTAVDRLYKELDRENKGIVIIMEGPKKAMNKFMDDHNILKNVFTARYDIEGLSNKALVEYAKRYAKEQEYSLDELAVLALHSRIDDMQTNDHSVTIEEVKEIVNEAIDKANKKNLRHFFDVLCSNRYDEEDMIILRERDFETE